MEKLDASPIVVYLRAQIVEYVRKLNNRIRRSWMQVRLWCTFVHKLWNMSGRVVVDSQVLLLEGVFFFVGYLESHVGK